MYSGRGGWELCERASDLEGGRAAATVNRIRLGSETVLQIVARDASDQNELVQRASLMELELMSEPVSYTHLTLPTSDLV